MSLSIRQLIHENKKIKISHTGVHLSKIGAKQGTCLFCHYFQKMELQKIQNQLWNPDPPPYKVTPHRNIVLRDVSFPKNTATNPHLRGPAKCTGWATPQGFKCQ